MIMEWVPCQRPPNNQAVDRFFFLPTVHKCDTGNHRLVLASITVFLAASLLQSLDSSLFKMHDQES